MRCFRMVSLRSDCIVGAPIPRWTWNRDPTKGTLVETTRRTRSPCVLRKRYAAALESLGKKIFVNSAKTRSIAIAKIAIKMAPATMRSVSCKANPSTM